MAIIAYYNKKNTKKTHPVNLIRHVSSLCLDLLYCFFVIIIISVIIHQLMVDYKLNLAVPRNFVSFYAYHLAYGSTNISKVGKPCLTDSTF